MNYERSRIEARNRMVHARDLISDKERIIQLERGNDSLHSPHSNDRLAKKCNAIRLWLGGLFDVWFYRWARMWK